MELIEQLRRGLVDLHRVVGLSELLSSRLVALPLLCAVVKPVALLSVL